MNNNNKIIVSSYAIVKLINVNCEGLLSVKSEHLMVNCINRNLYINKFSEGAITVESQNDWRVNVSVYALKKLTKIAGLLQEQPIVLTFEDSGRIYIHAAEL